MKRKWARLRLRTRMGAAMNSALQAERMELQRQHDAALEQIAHALDSHASGQAGTGDAALPLRMQGNSDLYTQENLRKRKRLANHFMIREIASKFWELLVCAPQTPGGSVNTVSDAGSSRGGKDERGQVNVEASFTKYDADGSGSVSITELGLICADLGVIIPRADLELTMASLDADGSGQLERDEFMRWWTSDSHVRALGVGSAKELAERRRLIHIYQRYDDDGSGLLDGGEFARMYDELKRSGEPGWDAPISSVVRELDPDGSGDVSFNEFLLWRKAKGGAGDDAILREATVDKHGYTKLMMRLSKAMLPDFDEDSALAMIESDWAKDSGGEGHMTFLQFNRALFEVADMWCEGIDAREYRNLLLVLFCAITQGMPPRVKALDDIDCADIESLVMSGGTAGVGKTSGPSRAVAQVVVRASSPPAWKMRPPSKFDLAESRYACKKNARKVALRRKKKVRRLLVMTCF
jgi:Ca2+-binding EF-hand superfamily protein